LLRIAIIGHFSTSAKFRETIKIPQQQRANSTARLKILRPAENSEP